jgi:hypothetical protein
MSTCNCHTIPYDPRSDRESFLCDACEPVSKPIITFYCSAKKKLDHPPTAQELKSTGGYFLGGTFYLNNGEEATTSSGACKKCLIRKGQTNEWQGPEHVFVLVEDQWIKFKNTPLYQ